MSRRNDIRRIIGNRQGRNSERELSTADFILSNPALNNFPDPRDYTQEYGDMLAAQVQYAPQIFESEKQYRPQYAQLDYDIFSSFLPKYLESQIENQPLLSELNTATRQAEIDDILNLSPQAMDALRAANPEAAAVLDTMTAQAQDELALGGDLSADERRKVIQNTRAGFADRGMAMGNPAIFAEVMNLDSYGRQRKNERRGFAADVVNLNKIAYGDPWMAILGRPSGAQNAGQFIPGSMQTGPQMFGDESQYAASLNAGNQALGQNIGNIHAGAIQDYFNTIYNAQQAMRLADKNADAAITGAQYGLAGNLIGAGSTASALYAACWIARAAYGESDPRWLKFRRWLLTKAPRWFVAWYMEYGPSIGERLKDDPVGRRSVREWMDTVLTQAYGKAV